MHNNNKLSLRTYVICKPNVCHIELTNQLSKLPAKIIDIKNDICQIKTTFGQEFEINTSDLMPVPAYRELEINETVEFIRDVDLFKINQIDHGGFCDLMKMLFNKTLEVLEIHNNSMITVRYMGMQFVINRRNLITDDYKSYHIYYMASRCFIFYDPSIAEKFENQTAFEIYDEELQSSFVNLLEDVKCNNIDKLHLYSKDILSCGGNFEEEFRFPLLYAMQCDNMSIFQLLLELGASTEARYCDGNTILHYIVRLNKLDYFKCLMTKCLDRTAKLQHNNFINQSPAKLAIKHNSIDILKEILSEERYLQIENKDNEDSQKHELLASMIHDAITHNHFEMIQLLLQYDSQLTSAFNKDSLPAFLYAVIRQNFQVVELMLQMNGSLVKLQRRNNGIGCLHLLVINRISLDTIKHALITWSGLDVNQVDHNHCTALHLAVNYDLALSKLLIEHGADVNFQDLSGNSPLHRLMKAVKSHSAQFVDDMIELFIQHNANLQLINHQSNSIQSMIDNYRNSQLIACADSIDASLSKKALEQMRDNLMEARNKELCKICFNSIANIVITCGHCLCGSCSNKLKYCPFCRKSIDEKIKIQT